MRITTQVRADVFSRLDARAAYEAQATGQRVTRAALVARFIEEQLRALEREESKNRERHKREGVKALQRALAHRQAGAPPPLPSGPPSKRGSAVRGAAFEASSARLASSAAGAGTAKQKVQQQNRLRPPAKAGAPPPDDLFAAQKSAPAACGAQAAQRMQRSPARSGVLTGQSTLSKREPQ